MRSCDDPAVWLQAWDWDVRGCKLLCFLLVTAQAVVGRVRLCKCNWLGMRITMPRFLMAALLGAALTVPMAITPTALRAEDKKARKYHDKKNNDDHEWNSHEDQAHRMWETENHRQHRDFDKMNENDRQSYWGWRHDHSDSLLKIEIH